MLSRSTKGGICGAQLPTKPLMRAWRLPPSGRAVLYLLIGRIHPLIPPQERGGR
jgi:hypothetical protein